MKTVNELKDAVLKAGGKEISNAVVNTVSVQTKETATYVRFYLKDNTCLGYRKDDYGIRKLVEDAKGFDVSLIDLFNVLDNMPQMQSLHSIINRTPKALEQYLAGCTVTFCQINQEGKVVKNFWTDEDYERELETNVTSYITSIKLSKEGIENINRAKLLALGIIDVASLLGFSSAQPVAQPKRRRSTDEDSDE